ncbi:midcut-by-XrtH protein [Parahaliea mediterranea]|uniref:midcut-by-XrtH protein n=1 Tax=Parahaliea mediterranea TaxID=651086 RepID=UPI0014754FD0|nr:midcut-by-XrtH protein [Parahaliea mediterranea]
MSTLGPGSTFLLLLASTPSLAQTGSLTYRPAVEPAAGGGSTVQAVPIPSLLLLPLAIGLAVLGGRYLRRQHGKKLHGILLLAIGTGLGAISSMQVPTAIAALMIALSQPGGGTVDIPLGEASYTNTAGVALAITDITPPPACTSNSPANECVTGMPLPEGASCHTDYTCTLPEVTVIKQADGVESGSPTPGAFTLARTGDTTNPLDVSFTLGGSATGITGTPTADLTDAEDYAVDSLTAVTIPAGASSVDVTITVLDDQVYDPSETVELTLTASAAYTIGAESAALMSISSEDKRIFVTAGSFNGDLGGIAGADQKCNEDANKPSGGVYAALLGGADRGPDPAVDWVLSAGTSYFNATEDFIARANTVAVFDFPLNLPFSTSSSLPIEIWTGIDIVSAGRWAVAPETCSSWSSSDTALEGAFGWSDLDDAFSIRVIELSCNVFDPGLYCVEQ